MSFYIFFIIFVTVFRSNTIAQRNCLTPTRAKGLCVPYDQCLYIKQQYEKFNQVVPPVFIDFLRRSRCQGDNNAVVHICCESSMVERTTTTQRTTSTTRRTNTRRPSNDGNYLNRLDPTGLAELASIKCGPQNSNRISQGNKTDLAEFPWMALLRYDNNEQPYQCGGSLITNRFVLTAAHCMKDTDFELIGVTLGEHDLRTSPDCQLRGSMQICSPPAEEFGIEKLIVHPEYSKHYFLNDIGLIRLDRDVIFKRHIKPICLPIVESASKPINMQYFIAGWGTTESGSSSKVLLRAQVNHQDREVCQKAFGRVQITENHICAGGDGISDTCRGDSGGPLFFLADYSGIPRYVQFGIVSFGGVKCGSKKVYPGIYSNLLELLPWLTQNIVN